MENDFDSDEDRIRRKAHELWESEGRPHGWHEAHWTMAREIIANEDSLDNTLIPLGETLGDEPAEPAVAVENQGEFPGLADQGEESARAPRRAADGDASLTYGEPNGPTPPQFDVTDKPAREIEQRPDGGSKSEARSRRAAGRTEDVPIKGFHGGVEHSQEMKATRSRA